MNYDGMTRLVDGKTSILSWIRDSDGKIINIRKVNPPQSIPEYAYMCNNGYYWSERYLKQYTRPIIMTTQELNNGV